ncbi:IS4/Tn5 family transposase DNA-binding protein [Nostoc sp.]
MKLLEINPYINCDFGDARLTKRAVLIAEALQVKYGQPLSLIFKSASDLKRGYEFSPIQKQHFPS